MKLWVAIFLLLSIPGDGIKTISRINSYADRAAKAYQQQKYAEAITAYEYLLNDLEVQDDQLRLNLGHAYYKAGLLSDALAQYRLLSDHSSAHIRSVVHLQLGNIAGTNKKYLQALSLYRNALLADPQNETARYNYELVKKYLALHPEKAAQDKPEPAPEQEEDQLPPPAFDDEQPQPKQKPDANGDREAEADTPQPDPGGEQQQNGGKGNQPQNKQQEQALGNMPGETQGQQLSDEQDKAKAPAQGSSDNAASGDTRARTETNQPQVRISPEKARMLLDAMRDAELQYLQQLPKKAKSEPAKGKPNW